MTSGAHTYRSPSRRRRHRPTSRRWCSTAARRASRSHRRRAARLRRLRLRPPFHVTVVRGRNVQRAHHLIHTTMELPLIDRRRSTATGDVGDADADRRRALRRRPGADGCPRLGAPRRPDVRGPPAPAASSTCAITGRYGIPKLLAVIEGGDITRGGHSWLERRFLELVRRAGLPRPGDAAGAVSRAAIGSSASTADSRDACGRRAARLPMAPHEGAAGAGRRADERARPRRARAVAVHLRPGHARTRAGAPTLRAALDPCRPGLCHRHASLDRRCGDTERRRGSRATGRRGSGRRGWRRRP